MTEQQESKPNSEFARKELEYARELFIHLFADESPLTNLGYTARQRQAAKSAIIALENEGRFYHEPKPQAFIEGQDARTIVTTLKHGGYKLRGDYPPIWTPAEQPGYSYLNIRVNLNFVHDQLLPDNAALVIEILPPDVNLEDVDGLTKHLYEGSWISIPLTQDRPDPSFEKLSPSSTLRSRIFAHNATYRAGWVDEDIHLELVVETDIFGRMYGFRNARKVVDVWRRLPNVEFEGKIWTPFGKKPNPSDESIKRALEGKEEKQILFGASVPEQITIQVR